MDRPKRDAAYGTNIWEPIASPRFKEIGGGLAV